LELEPAALERAEVVDGVARRLRLAEEGPRDEDDADDRENGGEHERVGLHQALTRTSARPYRAASRRSSRASGQRAISDPPTKTTPASQIRFTSGFTSTFR